MAQHRQNHFFSYEQVLEGMPNAYRKKLAIIARGENPTWHVKNSCLPNSLTVKNPSMIYLTKRPLTQSRAHHGILSIWSSFHLLLKSWNNFVLCTVQYSERQSIYLSSWSVLCIIGSKVPYRSKDESDQKLNKLMMLVIVHKSWSWY